jgi:putative ATPase
MPEANTALAQAAVYLATAPKSNAVYAAYGDAARDATEDVAEPVPAHLRNAPTRLMKTLGYGKGYQYAHDQPGSVVTHGHRPSNVEGHVYYVPTDRGYEATIQKLMEERRKRR